MNTIGNVIRKRWHWIFAGGIFACESLILLLCREHIYVGICDNLDLFITQLKMLHDNGAFFVHHQEMPILGSIHRNYFPSEFSLYNILYLILPDIYAYIAGFALKLVIALCSCVLLAKLVLGKTYQEYEKIVVLVAVAFATLPLYPMYAICFASLPLILYLFIRIYRESNKWLYFAVFLYPLLSYFTFFGAFLLGYLLIAIIVLWIRDKKPSLRLVGAFVALMLGFVCFEYRLFSVMLLSDEATIRSTMVIANYGIADLWKSFVTVFLYGFSHAKSVHTYFVLPVCALYFIWNNIQYVMGKKKGKVYADAFNLTVLFIVFNCVVYAFYFWEPLRNLIEALLPPLKGFQYGRTIFFNAFAWYFAFFIAVKDLCQKHQRIAYLACILAIVAVGGTQCEYSDFYNTCYCNLYKLVKHKEVNQLSYGEFYGAPLLKDIKKDIGYTADQGACAYGFHPAMLSYNGITTIDGYCGYYSQSYKEQFRTAIAPTLDSSERWQKYYDEWGCRAYLFSASGENLYDFGANADAPPQDIQIDASALKELGCDYIFSRVEITNAADMGLDFFNKYDKEGIPYSVYLYELK
ncbi:MAG: hypothetical protein HDR19_07175 [Lachnospiraceae bacterium]|nr:hypothetical protein [Lachnospiraceae bacterium]